MIWILLFLLITGVSFLRQKLRARFTSVPGHESPSLPLVIRTKLKCIVRKSSRINLFLSFSLKIDSSVQRVKLVTMTDRTDFDSREGGRVILKKIFWKYASRTKLMDDHCPKNSTLVWWARKSMLQREKDVKHTYLPTSRAKNILVKKNLCLSDKSSPSLKIQSAPDASNFRRSGWRYWIWVIS